MVSTLKPLRWALLLLLLSLVGGRVLSVLVWVVPGGLLPPTGDMEA